MSRDRFEKAAFVAHLEQQKAKLGNASSAGDDDGGTPADAAATTPAAAPAKAGPRKTAELNPARAAAFVDLVHTLVNANEFTYRF